MRIGENWDWGIGCWVNNPKKILLFGYIRRPISTCVCIHIAKKPISFGFRFL